LADTVLELIRLRIEAQMRTGAKQVKYRGPKTQAHIEEQSRKIAENKLGVIAYNATNPDYQDAWDDPYRKLLSYELERELLLRYDRGVLSLGRRYNCPLMWSHYGDQHQGICVGYGIPEGLQGQLFQVKYGGQRTVRASLVSAMLRGEAGAQSAVDEAVLLRKARDWSYEKEWRLLGSRGTKDSPLELVEVLFGMRCTDGVKHAVASSLARRTPIVKLYEMHEVASTFTLKRRRYNEEENAHYYPRRALTAVEGFEDVPDELS
jgi:hypothetical protein